MIDRIALKRKVEDAGTTFDNLAEELGIDRSTLFRRLRTGTIKLVDIQKIQKLLSLTKQELFEIFFASGVA